MSLTEPFQQVVNLNVLYEVTKDDYLKIVRLFINTGSLDIYVSDSATVPTSISDMVLNPVNTDVKGLIPFTNDTSNIRRGKYFALVQHSGVSTEIIMTGMSSLTILSEIS